MDDTLTEDLVSTSTPVGSIVNTTCSSITPSHTSISKIALPRFNPYNNGNANAHETTILPHHEIYQQDDNSNTSERHCDISTLQIDSKNLDSVNRDLNTCDADSVASIAFSLKQYDCGNKSGIDFGGFGSKRNSYCKGPLVKPPKFMGDVSNRKGVAKSSWVAGGYWLNNKYQQNKSFFINNTSGKRDLPRPISRSSSQSSGFVSNSCKSPLSQPASFFKNSNSTLINEMQGSNLGNYGRPSFAISEPSSSLNKAKSGSTFSLNPMGDQLAFFDTTISTDGGNSRPNSPNFSFSKDDRVNEFVNNTRAISRISKRFTNISGFNGKERDNSSFNSSLDRLTQEAFSELQPKAESSPKHLVNKCDNGSQKTWMEKTITIYIPLYSILLFLSVAVNVALAFYFMS